MATGKTPIKNGLLQSDLDCAGHNLTNLGGTVGLGTVTSVGLDFTTASGSAPETAAEILLSVANSPITGSGVMHLSLPTQAAKTFFGNFTNATAVPKFADAATAAAALGLVGATQPTLTDATVLQGDTGHTALTIQAINNTTGNFLNCLALDGATSKFRVDTTGTLQVGMIPNARVSGLVASATTDTTNASNINQGTLAKARTLGTTAYTDQSNYFQSSTQQFKAGSNFQLIGSTDDSVVQFDLSAISALSTRTVTIPDAASTTVRPRASAANYFLTGIESNGTVDAAMPAFSDISGAVTAAQLPNPSSSTLGGVQSYAAVSNQWINAISTSGVPASTQPAFTDISGTLAINKGGSGQTTANAAFNAFAPSQTSNAGKFLTTDGAGTTSWATVAGGGTFSSFSIVNANGFYGSVAASTTDPALTLYLADSGDATKKAHFVLSANTTGTDRAITVPNANSTLVVANTGASHSFLTAISASGAVSLAQPAIADLSDGKTGSGNLVLATSPTLTTPTLGTATATAINGLTAAVTPNAAGGSDLGSTALPFANLYVGGAATNNNKITSVMATAARTFTLPDANSNSVIPDSGAANNFLTAISSGGVISKAQPAFTNISGSVAASQMPALTGDVTTSAGAVATTLATISKNFTLTGIVSPSQITGSQNDYNPTGWTTGNTLRISSNADTRNITGLAGGASGRMAFLTNVGGTYNYNLVDESASSTATNRWALPYDQYVRPDDLIIGLYDSTSGRWRSSASHSHHGADIVQGTVSPVYGGTGVSNAGASTITLGGSLTTSGANNVTLTTSGATNVTLPTSGTLSTLGYALQAHSGGAANPVDATTYYFGSQGDQVVSTTAALSRVYIPTAGTIKKIYLSFVVDGTLGSSGNSTVSLRLNNSTDTTITSTLALTAVVNTANNAALSIAVAAGDYFEIKWLTPTWTTNPVGVRGFATVYIE